MEVNDRLHVPCEWALREEFPIYIKHKGGVTSLARYKTIFYSISVLDLRSEDEMTNVETRTLLIKCSLLMEQGVIERTWGLAVLAYTQQCGSVTRIYI
jgi:hypothetical protein